MLGCQQWSGELKAGRGSCCRKSEVLGDLEGRKRRWTGQGTTVHSRVTDDSNFGMHDPRNNFRHVRLEKFDNTRTVFENLNIVQSYGWHSYPLLIRRTRSNFGDRAFSAAGPRVCNYLPTDLRQPDLSHSRFRQSPKTFLIGQRDQSAVWFTFNCYVEILVLACLVFLRTSDNWNLGWTLKRRIDWETNWDVVVKWYMPTTWRNVCRSSEWNSVPDKVKQDIGLQIKTDGEFWCVVYTALSMWNLTNTLRL